VRLPRCAEKEPGNFYQSVFKQEEESEAEKPGKDAKNPVLPDRHLITSLDAA
jgi:hypothetical protein